MGLQLLLTQTCSVERYLGEGAYGPRYAAPVPLACRTEDVVELVRDDTGEQVVSSGRVFIEPAGETHVTARSRITVNGATRIALAIGRGYGRDALHHLDVRLR